MRLLRLALMAALALGAAVTATTRLSAAADHGDRFYLALGDSLAFGYITQAGFEYGNADNFVGYPAYVAGALRLDRVDASCPGETTGSFRSAVAPDKGCRAFRAKAPLHVPYTGTQLQFATSFLRAHRETHLVTITLGANDLFLLEGACGGDPNCEAAGLPNALAAIALNVRTTLADLRATGFEGRIVVSDYYAVDYTDIRRTQITALLNTTLRDAAAAEGAGATDAFDAFRAAVSTPFAGGQPCRAGLLNALPDNQFQCDIHPSQSGAQLFARVVTEVARHAMHGD